eukprot:PhM_4_TR10995/c0_g1_i1/m.29182
MLSSLLGGGGRGDSGDAPVMIDFSSASMGQSSSSGAAAGPAAPQNESTRAAYAGAAIADRVASRGKKQQILKDDWLKRHLHPKKPLFHSSNHMSIQHMSNKIALGD